jgi:hypothetical protein
MKASLREVLFVCSVVIALVSGIAAATIALAIVTNKLPDSEAWMTVLFFAAFGGAAWIAGSAVK